MSADRTHRLWRQAGLQVPKTAAAATRGHRSPAAAAADGAQSRLGVRLRVRHLRRTGSTLKCLTVIDEFTRECLAIDVAGGIRSGRVIEVLTQLVSVHGAPRYLRSDNGPEFVARAILRWLQRPASRRRSSIRASRGRMAPTNRSTASFATSISDAAVVSESRRGQGRHRAVAAALQRGPAAFESRVSDAAGVQSDLCSQSHGGALAGDAGSR